MNIIKFEDTTEELTVTPVEDAAEPAEEEPAGPDYSQLLYEYLVDQDIQDAARQEEIYAAYSGKLDTIITQQQDLSYSLEWVLAFQMFFAVLLMFKNVRRWLGIMSGGNRNV